MSYRIQYGPPQKGEPVNSRISPKILGIAAWVGLAAVLVFLLASPQAVAAIRNFLLPGDPAVTQAAASRFVESVKGGSAIGQAVAAFCREIIESA